MVPKKIKLLFSFPCGLVLFYSLYLISKYNDIPYTIPIHGYGEKADICSSKVYLFLTIGINIILLIFFWFLIKNPHKLNLPIEITDDNKEIIYKNIQIFLVCTSIFITIIFCILFSDVVF